MDNENFSKIRKKISNLFVPIAFATFIFIILSGIFLKYTEVDFKNNAVDTQAVITGYTEYGIAILSYTVGEKEYKVSSRKQIPDSQIGDKIQIKYHKRNPTFIEVGENPLYKDSVSLIIIGILGLFSLALFLIK